MQKVTEYRNGYDYMHENHNKYLHNVTDCIDLNKDYSLSLDVSDELPDSRTLDVAYYMMSVSRKR